MTEPTPPPGFRPVEQPPPPPGFRPVEQPTGLPIIGGPGAPMEVRRAVGTAVTPEDKLATIRQWFPDAQFYANTTDNFVYTDPQSGRLQIYNPEGLDIGDIPSAIPEMHEMAGGVVGGIASLPAAAAAGAATGGAAALPVVAAGVGLGAAGAREADLLAQQTFGNVVDTRNLPEHLTDTATIAGVNAAGHYVGGVAGRAAGQYLRNVFGPLIRRPFTSTTASQLSADFANVGVRPMAGAITGNRATQIAEHGLANLPGGASVMQRATNEALEELANARTALARRYSAGQELLTDQELGELMQSASRGAVERFGARQEQLYDIAYAGIAPDLPVGLSEVATLRGELYATLASAPQSMQRQLQPAILELDALIADAGQSGYPFEILRRYRTDLGKRIGDGVMAGENTPQREYLQAVYGAVSRDMSEAAVRAKPDNARVLEVADRYTRYHMAQTVERLNRLIAREEPEKVFREIFQSTDTQFGATTINRLRRNFTAEEWQQISGTILGRMGRAIPSQQGDTALDAVPTTFSPATFMTTWNRLSPQARTALFGGTQYESLVPELEGLVRVTNAMQESARMGNPSGTARNLLLGLGFLGAGERAFQGDPLGATGVIFSTVVAPRMAAKLMTSPHFVNWLAGAVRTGQRGGSVAGHMTRLVAVAEAEPEIRDEIHAYLESVANLDAQQQASFAYLEDTARRFRGEQGAQELQRFREQFEERAD